MTTTSTPIPDVVTMRDAQRVAWWIVTMIVGLGVPAGVGILWRTSVQIAEVASTIKDHALRLERVESRVFPAPK